MSIFEDTVLVKKLQRSWDNSPIERAVMDRIWGYFVNEMTSPAQYEKVLDVGCGTGRMAKVFKESSYHGCDSSAAMLEQCRGAKGITNLKQCSIYELGYKVHEFDAVLCHAVLFHIGNIPAAIDELAGIEPGGRLVFSVYYAHCLKHKGNQIFAGEDEASGTLYPSYRNVLPMWMLCRTVGVKYCGIPIGQNLQVVKYARIETLWTGRNSNPIAFAIVDKK